MSVIIEETEAEGEFVSVSLIDEGRVVLELGSRDDGWFVTLNWDERETLIAALLSPSEDTE